MKNTFETIDCSKFGFGDLFAHCEVENLHWDHRPYFFAGGLLAELAHGAWAIYDGHTSRGWVLFGDKTYAQGQFNRFIEKYKGNKSNTRISFELEDAFNSEMKKLRDADR